MTKIRFSVCLLLVFFLVVVLLTGCNKQIFDTNYKFNYAIINTFDGVVEGEISTWRDYDDCDMVQVTFSDGTVYYTHGSNVILIKGD